MANGDSQMANVYKAAKRVLHGRSVIYSSVEQVDETNLLDVLDKALRTHDNNKTDIEYLWNYYKGKQPIESRQKDVRPEICNTICENTANEIASFKVGYQFGEPVQYVSRSGKEETAQSIELLNEYMFAEDKAASDQELGEWQFVTGTAYRLVLPDTEGEEDEAPFEMFVLNPASTFVVYSTDIGNKPLMGCTYSTNEETGDERYCIYTPERYYEVMNKQEITIRESHSLGMIPIFEYPLSNARMGCFEAALPLLDMQNDLLSNRMDGIEQNVQAFLKFINCDIDTEGFENLRREGAIKVKSVDGANADVDVVVSDLDQQQVQTLVDDVHTAILTICGMPSKSASSSISDTGAAVLLRDGWSLAEARAKDAEHVFKRSEKQMLRLVLNICTTLSGAGFNLKLSDIDMRFTRRNYEAVQSKSQVLISMLQQNKIHPLLAFEHSGLFSDPEAAYLLSMEYYNEQVERWQPVLASDSDEEEEENDETEDVSADGQVSDETETSDTE